MLSASTVHFAIDQLQIVKLPSRSNLHGSLERKHPEGAGRSKGASPMPRFLSNTSCVRVYSGSVCSESDFWRRHSELRDLHRIRLAGKSEESHERDAALLQFLINTTPPECLRCSENISGLCRENRELRKCSLFSWEVSSQRLETTNPHD